MEKNSLKKQYKDNSLEELFRPLPMPEPSRVVSKPTPQPKPQPKAQAPVAVTRMSKENPEMLSAFNKKYSEIIKSGHLKGEDYDSAKALFKERWEADREGRKIRPRPGSPLDIAAREEGYGRTVYRKREPGEYDIKPNKDQSPADRARATGRLSESLAKLKID